MAPKNDETIADTNANRHAFLIEATGWFIAAGAVAVIVAWAVYILVFHSNEFVRDPAAWGQVGDFMGGVLNPILSFLTLVILSITIILQSRQLDAATQGLELSRQELKATREELARSARAQELSEQALRAQAEGVERSARISCLNALLVEYRKEIAAFPHSRYGTGDPRQMRLDHLRKRERHLLKRLDDMFEEVVGESAD